MLQGQDPDKVGNTDAFRTLGTPNTRELTKTGPEGEILRDGSKTIVRLTGNNSFLLNEQGVVCENPEAPENERTYRREFLNKKIYLPNELDKARSEILAGEDVIILGGTGYSRVGKDICQEYKITDEAYVSAYADILGSAIIALQKRYPKVQVKLVDGASDLGIDRGTIRVADHFKLPHLGFSCPEYMFYVNDDHKPVYVGGTREEYSKSFTKSLDVLISAGGRVQSLQNDMSASIMFGKKLILVDVISLISPTGTPAARNAKGEIVNGTRAFFEAVKIVTESHAGTVSDFDAIKERVNHCVINIAGKALSPEAVFHSWKNEKPN